MILYYTKKISPLYSQTNLSISVFDSKFYLLYLRDRKIIIHINKIHGISLYYLISRLLDSIRITVYIFAESQHSQTVTYFLDVVISFKHLQNCTTLKHAPLITPKNSGLIHLQNYSTLKQGAAIVDPELRLRHLQNYITLKQTSKNFSNIKRLRYLQNYTTLKLYLGNLSGHCRLRYLQNYTTLKQSYP